jgi:hypothetical protein
MVMIEDDIDALMKRDALVSLQALEADVWRQEAVAVATMRASHRIASWQAAILVAAVMSSAAVGILTATRSDSGPRPHLLAAAESLAPSNRLFGGQR